MYYAAHKSYATIYNKSAFDITKEKKVMIYYEWHFEDNLFQFVLGITSRRRGCCCGKSNLKVIPTTSLLDNEIRRGRDGGGLSLVAAFVYLPCVLTCIFKINATFQGNTCTYNSNVMVPRRDVRVFPGHCV